MPSRPTFYTPELAERILRELRAGRSVQDICRDGGMPCRDTVFEWVRQDREGFAARYRQDRETGHGRPGYVAWSPEIAEAVLEELMAGRTLSEVCGDPGMPGLTAVCRWVASDREGFAERYRAARQAGERRQAEVAHSVEIADRVILALMKGRTLGEICAEPDMPSTAAVHNWIKADHDGFRARYHEAREIGCQAIADDMVKIVDDRDNDWIVWRDSEGTLHSMLDPERVTRARLRVDTRWKLLCRMLPRTLGERPGGDGRGATASELDEMRRLIDGRSRGLPSEDSPLDQDSLRDED